MLDRLGHKSWQLRVTYSIVTFLLKSIASSSSGQKNTTFFCLPRIHAVHASFRMPRKRLRTSGHSKASSWCSATSNVTKMAWVGNWRWQFRLIVASTVINCYLLPIVILLDTLKTCLYFFPDFGLSHHFKIIEQPWIYDLYRPTKCIAFLSNPSSRTPSMIHWIKLQRVASL